MRAESAGMTEDAKDQLRKRAEMHLAEHADRLRRGEVDEIAWWAEVVLLLVNEKAICAKCKSEINIAANS